MKEKRKIYLIEEANKYNTNVSFMKFVAAILVIISHAFPLVCGKESIDIVGKITNGTITFGLIAVNFFF